MARAKNFLKGLGSSILLLATTAVCSLVSLRIAYQYLGEDIFGIWVVTSQIAGYLALLDLGTTGAGTRLLVEHKDAPGQGGYGSLIKSICFTQVIQSGLILTIGIGCVPLLDWALDIQVDLVSDFNLLWCWQVVFLATNFALRIGSQILTAHQRLDINNYILMGAAVVNFIVLILGFFAGLKLYSFILAQGVSMFVSLGGTLVACLRLQLFPPRDAWGKLSRNHLKSLLSFGSDVFLITLGAQFISSSQTFILTRSAGFGAASTWAVMTKLFTLLTQLVWRVLVSATPAFSEMFVRREHDRLWLRYRAVFELSMVASAYFGILIGLGNTAFVDIWMSGAVRWPPLNDWLLAIWFLLLTQSSYHNGFVVNTKRVLGLKFVYFFEGIVFIGLSLLVVPGAGITGMLACSVVCTACFTVAYGTYRVAGLLRAKPRRIALDCLRPTLRFIAVVLPVGIVLALLTQNSAQHRLVFCVGPVGILGGIVGARICAREIPAELISQLPAWIQRLVAVLVRGKIASVSG